MKPTSCLKIGSAFGRILFISLFFFSVLPLLLACAKKDGPEDPVANGRSFYTLHCMACHNPNPALDGPLGPAIKGSSLELIEARTLRAEYPPGYTPKRDTKVMPRLPLTAEDIQNIHAFLNAPKK